MSNFCLYFNKLIFITLTEFKRNLIGKDLISLNEHDDHSGFIGKDNPVTKDFIDALNRARLAGLHNIDEMYCMGLPNQDNIIEINGQHICKEAIYVYTYVNYRFVSICHKHKSILIDYLTHINQIIKEKNSTDNSIDIENRIIEEILTEEVREDQKTRNLKEMKFKYKCANRTCDQTLPYLGLCDKCIKLAELKELEELGNNPDDFWNN